jgi:hypothetical protein
MGMWRSLHPFKSERPTKKRNRPQAKSRQTTGRAATEARKALKRRALIERFEERAMLSGAPQLISILANSGDVVYSPNTAGQVAVLHTSPRELDLTFNQGSVIDPTTLGGIEVVGAGVDGKLNTADDVPIQPGFVGIGNTPNTVVLRFSQTLSDGEYEITLLGKGPNALADSNSPPDLFNSGNAAQPNLQVAFTVDAGPHVVSVVPEPITYNATTKQLQQNTNEIDVYFDKAIAPLPQTVNQLDPRLFQLILTGDTANTTNQSSLMPSSVSFDYTTNKATLLFPFALDTFGTGAMRLRIGNNQQVVTPIGGTAVNTQPLTTTIPEPGSTFGDTSQSSLAPYTVVNLDGTTQHQILQTVLGASNINPNVGQPGGNYGVGVRNDPVEQHIDYSESPLGNPAFAAMPTPGTVPTYTYNFPDVYGGTAVSPLHNVITSDQENLARQIFQLWSNYLGVQFKEVSNSTLGAADFGIVTGVVQAVNPTAASSLDAIAGPAPTSPNTVNGVPEYLAVMNAQVYANESLYGGPWFTAAMQQIGRLLGLGFDGEGPPGTVMGLGGNDPATGAAPEPVFPGNADILHGQSIYQPKSDNVDMYSFTLHSSGQFSAETIAQRAYFNVITIPSGSATGGVGSDVVDGSMFSVADGSQTVTFEFVANGRVTTNQLVNGKLPDGNLPIFYNSTDSAETVAGDVAAAINGAATSVGLKATAGAYANQVDLSGPITVTPSAIQGSVTYSQQPSELNSVLTLYSQSNVIQVPENTTSANGAVGTSVVDGSTFTLNDGTHPQVTFEFAANGRVLSDGNTPIAFSSTQDNAHNVAVEIANAINAAAAKTGLLVTASVQFDQVVLNGPVTVTHSATQGGVTYTVSRTIISRNDDYFGNDSFVQMELSPGIYYVAVTSTGNTQFDPNVPGSGSGGTTQGPYDLKLDFTPAASTTLTDMDGNPLAGNSDGTSGGAYDFWFNVGNTIFVDKTPPALTSGPLGSLTNPYTTVSAALQVAADRLIAPGGGTPNLDGQTFVVNDGVNTPVTFEFAADGRQLTDGNVAVNFNSGNVPGTPADTPTQVATDIATAIQSEVNLGSLSGSVQPATNGNVVDVTGALFVDAKGSAALMASPKIVRILGTGIADNSLGVPATDASGNSVTAGQIVNSGQSFTITAGTVTATFEFITGTATVSSGAIAVQYANSDTSARLAQEIAAAINASPLAQPAGGDIAATVGANATAYTNGDAWFVNLTGVGQLNINAQNASQVTNSSGTVTALGLIADSNAAPYEIGVSQFGGGPLADGSDLTIPQNVTVMIDAGAIVKMEGANISVGVNSPNVDRSQSALQVLGTPSSSVFFTSFHDDSIGQVTDTVTSPSPGDWGGIVFGPAADLESQGIFLDNVNHARLNYAGGTVVVNGQQQAYNPIYLTGSRPTITNNTILNSRDSALSADPNSFGETFFGTPAVSAGSLPPPVQIAPSSSPNNGDLAGTYYYVVTAVGPAGETVASNETSITVNGPTGEVNLNWFPVAGATGYRIYRGTAAGTENMLVGTVPNGSTTSFVDGVVGAVVLTGQKPPVNPTFDTDYERAGPDISGNTLAVTQPGALTLIAAAGNQILAGETFKVTNPNTGVISVFEFVNSVASPTVAAGQLLSDGHYAVLFSPGVPATNNIAAVPPDTAAQVATKIVTAIQAANIGVTASVSTNPTTNGTQVIISGASSVVPTTPSSFAAPAGSQIVTGETFVVTNLATGAQATFEFITAGQTVASGDVAVTFAANDTSATVAGEMTAAINGANLGVLAVLVGDQVVLSGAQNNLFANVTGAGITAVTPRVLNTSAGSKVTDGTTFQIFNSKTGSSLTFEYHLSTDTTSVASGDIAIVYNTTDTNNAIAAETAAAINGAGIAAEATVSGNIVSLLETPTGAFASPLSVQSNVVANTVNGLFVRTQDTTTQSPATLTVQARWTATDIPYVLSDNLIVQGNPGGTLDNTPRLSGRLDIDPGVTVKLNNARIETQFGADFIAEGTASEPIVFTSLHDGTYGGGGTFATDGVPANSSSRANVASPGDWSGLYFAPTSRGSLDHTLIAYAGGNSTVQGSSNSFDAVEIHQATVRVADSTIEYSASGLNTGSRGDLGPNDAAVVYVLGAQPIIVNNVFLDNQGATISINVNSLTSAIVPDPGRSTGPVDRFNQFDTNQGPLVRLNEIGNVLTNVGAINGMLVRGGTLDSASVWDDTDIVYVVNGQVQAGNIDTVGGLTLKSNATSSLVVKFKGGTSGLTATGTLLDITNRIGGSVQIIGTPQHNVVLTGVADNTVGAGLTPDGRPQTDTNNTGFGATSVLGSGPLFIYGGDPDFHGDNNGPGGTNEFGWLVVQDALNFVYKNSRNKSATGILVIGATADSATGAAISAAAALGLPAPTFVTGAAISTVDFSKYRVIYVPSTTPKEPGGISQADLDLLDARKADITNYVNNIGGGVLAFTEVDATVPYDWLAVPNVLTTKSYGDAGNGDPLVETPAMLAAGFTVNNATINLGTPWHESFTGPPGFDNMQPFILDANTGEVVALGLASGSTGLGGLANSSSWQGVTFDQYSNDTNVATVNENEPANNGGVNTNGTPATAQPLGQLAPNLKSGDDNQRLGFVVNGAIGNPSDVDVYSFQAQPGSQVWMSLGNTSPGLNSVLELVDSNGTVLARSDNAADEVANPSLLTTPLPEPGDGYATGIGFAGNLAQPLPGDTLLDGNYDPTDSALTNTLYNPASQTDPGLRNLDSTNPHDAGFRVVLPVPSGGLSNGTAQYFVRVRSLGPNINALQGGMSSGAYQLTIGLQEAPLVPGSSVQYADIRYATNGITVEGLPDRSPLLANAGQTTDGSSTTDASSAAQASGVTVAQNLGNLLATDQAQLSVSGNLQPSATNPNLSTQVDWYKFTVNYDLVQLLQGSTNADKTFAAVFNVDYANGLSRANTTISVYNSAGQLIYVGRDSDVADNQPTPASANGLSDLTHGSSGQLDPYIGTVQLPAGEQGGTSETYYVAISSDATLPQALDGTFSAGSTNAAVRLEPIDSVNRVVEDHIGSQGGETAQSPSSLTPMFNGTVNTSASNFANAATQPVLATTQQAQQIASLNASAVPWTLSNVQLFVDQQPSGPQPTVNPTAGELYSLNLPASSGATTLQTNIGGLPGTGLGYNAMAIRNDGELYAMTYGLNDANAGRYDQLDIYNPDTAAGAVPTTTSGADNIVTHQTNGTTVQNVGVQIRTMAYVQNGTTRQLFGIGSYVGGTGAAAFTNGLYEFDPNTGAVVVPPDAANAGPGPTFTPVLLNPAGVSLTEQITGLASIGSTLYAVTNQGGLYIVNSPATGAASVQFIGQVKDANGNAIAFTGLTNGPPDVNNGAYANDLFGVDANGNLYAFNTSGTLQDIFNNGTSASVSLGLTNIVSLAFTTLDYNLWHVTDARATDPGHGINSAPDNSRNPQSTNQPQAGNLSFYFGLENPKSPGVIDTGTNTTLQPGAANYATATGANNVYGTYNLPGGALGSLGTNSFSLANYSAGDKPTLYFDYFLNTGMTANSTAGWKSSARVLISTDNGQTWQEVATNDPTRSAYNLATDPLNSPLGVRQNSQSSELPGFDSASSNMGATTQNGQSMVDPRQQVQQLFDSTGQWRQARIDLSNYAGQSNIMLRFDFSSAGSMNQGLVGDKFGNFTSNTRDQNNGHEGFYVDDITVGFAERGEMVTGDTATTNFFTTPQSPNANAPTQNFGGSGPYQFNVREATNYGVTVSSTAPDISLIHSFDTNDRLTDGFTIIAPAGAALTDGATFQISDASQHTVTFEFHLTTDTTGVAAGHVAVPFTTTSTAAQVAATIATAINANTTLVGVRAGTIQNTINGAQVVTGNRVDLFGATNLSSTQALLGTLTVSLANHTLTEGTGATTSVTVNRPTSSEANPVFVTVTATDVGGGPSQNAQFVDSNNNPLGTTVTVLIPAGQASASLMLGEVDQKIPNSNTLLADGPQKVQVTATAKSYGSNADTVDIVDGASVVPTLTLTLTDPSNGVILENAGAGAAHAVVSRNTPTNFPLTVTLTSLDPASASVPASVIIPAGQTSVSFPINAVDDNIASTQPINVAIVASALNFVDGTTSVAVQDNDNATDAANAALVGGNWQAQGPAPITGGQTTNTTSGSYNDPVDGAIETVLTVPNNPNVVYIGTVNGGVWKTTDATDPAPMWVPLTDNQPSLSIADMEFDSTDSTDNSIIVGIGRESNFGGIGGALSGVMYSKDGGQSWNVITPSVSSLVTPVGQDVSAVAERGTVFLVGTTASSSTVGLMRSTDDGSTFTLVSGALTSGLPAGPISDLVGDPIDQNRFYAAVLTKGIYTSDDGGATWSNVTPSALTLNASPTGDNIRIADSGQAVYFGYEKFNGTNTTLAALYRSPAVGLSSTTWTAMDLPTTVENSNTIVGLNPAGQGAVNFSIAADPNNPNIVYVGGDRQPGPVDGVSFPNSVGATNYTGRLFRGDASKPSGSQWTPITDDFTANDSAPHADSRSLAIDSSGRLIETDDGGIYTLSNPTTSAGTWTSLIGNGLQVTEINNLAYDTLTNTIVSGNEETGLSQQTTAGGTVWSTLPVSATGVAVVTGGDVAIDDSNVSTTGQSIRYTSAAKLAGFEATTYNASNTPVAFSAPQLVVLGTGGRTIYQVDAGLPTVTTVKLNALPGFSNRMVIAGGSGIYESSDDGQTLTQLRNAAGNLVGGAGPNALFGASIAYGGMIGGTANPDVLWVGEGTNVYLRSTSPTAGGVLAPTNYAGGAVVSLTINSNNWRNAFVIDANGHVWETVDGGVSYQDITGNLTVGANALTADLHSIAFVPGVSTNLVYVGSRDGVYQMQTLTPGVWQRYGAFMPNVPVMSLQYVPSQQLLVAGTLGRGAFTTSAINAAGEVSVTLNQQTVSDDSPANVITGTVSRQGTFGNLTVVLQSSDPVLVPNTPVTIPDGQSSVAFSINVNDLTDSQGNEVAIPQETVILTPQAAGLIPVSAAVNVSDTSDDAPQLTVTLSQNEINPSLGVNQITGTVTRNTRTDQPLTVTLVSSDAQRASVPTTVTIPAGQESVTFNVTANDQFLSDGQSQWVTITAYGVTYQGLGISSANGDGNDNESDETTPDGDEAFTVLVDTTQHLLSFNRQGDSAVVPLQGQIVIQDTRISNSVDYGIVLTAAARDNSGSTPYPGVPMNYQPLNTDRVVPGATVTNNLLVNNTQGGINIVGDSNNGNVPLAAVPIARILNNTIYGGASQTGTGVNVGANVSPTILNNIFANLTTGVSVAATSASTVLEASIYQNNGTNLSGNVANGGDLLSYALAPTDPLFTNAANNDFYLAFGSKAIDSAINQLAERSDLTTAKSLIGIPPSPTSAPAYDLFGQLRTADPQTNPNGVGSTLFKSRGAIERVDYTGPTATLANPIDNGSEDQDPTLNVVHLVGSPLANFAIQLNDTGTGVDDSTVTSSRFDLYRNGTLLKAGIDYFFQFDTNTQTVYFVPATGTWATGNTYTIFVDNGVKFDANSTATPVGIKDLAGNLLQANSATGYTRFDILLQGSTGDAPTIGVPPLQSVNENGKIATSLTFSSSSTPSNAITIFDIDAPNDTINVTLQTAQGTLSLPANLSGVTVTGSGTPTLTIVGAVPAVNAALNGTPAQNGQSAVPGLTFTPTLDFRGPATISVSATDPLLGSNGLTGTGVVQINVLPVNQPPVVHVPSQPLTVLENPVNGLVITGVTVTDVDFDPTFGQGVEQVTITVPNGTVALSTTNGLLFSQGTGNGSSMTFTGTLTAINNALNGMQFFPANDFAGNTSINITVNDLGNSPGPAMQGSGAVPIFVIPVNQPPDLIAPIPTVVVNETNQVGVTTVIDLSKYIGDPDESNNPPEPAPTLTVIGNTNPTIVSATINGQILTLTYVPYGRGTATITILATDNNQGTVHPTLQTSFSVVVNPVNYPPITSTSEYRYTPGLPLVVTAPGVLASDVDNDHNPLKAVLTQVPAHGQLIFNQDGSFTYTPDPGFNGRDSFIYVADDGQGNRVPATVFLDTANSFWVARMYTEVLGRTSPPADSEVNYWVGQLDVGASRFQVSVNFVTSPERRSQFINQLYEQYLGRPADPGGLNYWLSVWAANNGPEMVQAGIIGSIEFYETAGGTPQAWVTRLYQDLFNRNPDPGGLAYWTGIISANPNARATVVLGFVTSDEYHRQLLAGIPGDPNMPGWYEEFLHRPIDIGGENYWATLMDEGYPQETILEGILASDEYYNRS